MKYIYIGDVVNTHGIKGEIRIVSDFEYKKQVFQKGFKIYIGKQKEEQIISTYRPHKIYDMVTLDGFNNINDVLKYKGKKVYINKEDLDVEDFFDEDMIGLAAYIGNKYIGNVVEMMKNINYKIIVIKKDKKRNLVPNIPEFIEKVDLENHRILIKDIEGLIDEN